MLYTKKAKGMSGKWAEYGVFIKIHIVDYTSKSSRCSSAHPSNSRQNWMGEMFLTPYNIFIELILPCIIFREFLERGWSQLDGQNMVQVCQFGTLFVHVVHMGRFGIKCLGNCCKNI